MIAELSVSCSLGCLPYPFHPFEEAAILPGLSAILFGLQVSQSSLRSKLEG